MPHILSSVVVALKKKNYVFWYISVFPTNLSTLSHLSREVSLYTHIDARTLPSHLKALLYLPRTPTQTHHSQCKQLLCKQRMSKTKEGFKRNGWNKKKEDCFSGNYCAVVGTATAWIVVWACLLGTHDFVPVRVYPCRQETPTPQKTPFIQRCAQYRETRNTVCPRNMYPTHCILGCKLCVGLKHGFLIWGKKHVTSVRIRRA